jgi:type I restriction enzyme S subunit
MSEDSDGYAEAMTLVKDASFREVRLGEVFEQRNERGLPGLPVMSLTMDRGLVERASLDRRVESELPAEKHLLVRKGDIVYNTMRMWQGVSGLARRDCMVSPAYVVCRPRDELVPEYAAYLLKAPHVIRKLRSHSQGIVDDRLRLYFEHFASIVLRIPPRTIQARLALVFGSMDASIGAAELLVGQSLKTYESFVSKLLTDGVSDTARESKALPGVGTVPADWEVSPLGTVAEVGSGVTLGRRLNGSPVVEVPYLRVANVQDGYTDLREVKKTKLLESEVDRLLLRAGDVLMTEGGDFDKLGRGTVWQGEIEPCSFQNHIFRVRVRDDLLDPRFLAVITQSRYARAYFALNSKQTTNLASINSTQLKAFPVVRPPVAEQRRIVNVLGRLQEQLTASQSVLRQTQRLKEMMADALLTGAIGRRHRCPE